jgi:phosphatidylglycerol lysyltransferase
MTEETDSLEENEPVAIAPRAWWARALRYAWVLALAAALTALYHEWAHLDLKELNRSIGRIGMWTIGLALAITVLSYFLNACTGLAGEKWLGTTRPARTALTSSFIAAAFSNTAGGALLGGAPARLMSGYTPGQVAKLTGFSSIATWAGHAMISGVLLLIAPPVTPLLSVTAERGLGALLIAACLLVILTGTIVKSWRGKLPGLKLSAVTLALSALDWFAAGLVLWALVPGGVPMNPLAFVAIVSLAHLAGALSQIPGGLGAFETVLTLGLGGALAKSDLAAAMIVYRVVFYFVPFVIAVAMLAWRECVRRKAFPVLRAASAVAGRIVPSIVPTLVPRVVALMSFVGGFMMLLSAVTPIEQSRRDVLAAIVPLPFVEASNFISSLVGCALLILTRSLQRRVALAWWLMMGLLLGGAVFSLTKGIDYEEAIVLTVMACCLLPFRHRFDRRAALWTARFSLEWWVFTLVVVGVAAWAGFFAERNVAYSEDLWWQFSLGGDAPRFLRALAGVSIVLAMVALSQLMRPSHGRRKQAPVPPSPEVEELVAGSTSTSSALALLGDKSFALSSDEKSLLMYADRGRTRVVMGNVIGDETSGDSLLWDFAEQAESEGQRLAFYQVGGRMVSSLVEMGFRLYKLGEEARVKLSDFSMAGSQAKQLRKTTGRIERAGYSFALWSQETVAARIEELRAVSDAWLKWHRSAEKGFSLGRFDDSYMLRFPCAVVLDSNGAITAFANVWCSAAKSEISIDLMRHADNAPSGIMDYLVTQLLVHSSAEGWQYFNLGMAPLSGFSLRPLAPLWHRLARFIFQHAGTFYNFEGLRAWKEKFQPEWSPRYLAVSSAWSLPPVLLDITLLIGRKQPASLPAPVLRGGLEQVTLSQPASPHLA